MFGNGHKSARRVRATCGTVAEMCKNFSRGEIKLERTVINQELEDPAAAPLPKSFALVTIEHRRLCLIFFPNFVVLFCYFSVLVR